MSDERLTISVSRETLKESLNALRVMRAQYTEMFDRSPSRVWAKAYEDANTAHEELNEAINTAENGE